jgi:hypothetical protein
VDSTAGLDDVEKRKFLTLTALELRPLGHPDRSQSLYRLRYHGSPMKAYGGVALAGSEWLASRSGRFTPGTHWIGGWVDPTAGLDDVKKILYPLGTRIPTPRFFSP